VRRISDLRASTEEGVFERPVWYVRGMVGQLIEKVREFILHEAVAEAAKWPIRRLLSRFRQWVDLWLYVAALKPIEDGIRAATVVFLALAALTTVCVGIYVCRRCV